MKKIINGKVYDTDTAKQISYEGDTNHGSHREWENALYQKRTGEFFAYAWTMSGGETIQPITADEARAWLEGHGTADQYISVFGDPGEDVAESDEVVTLGIRVSAAAANKIKRAAAAEGTTQQAILERLIMQSMSETKKEKEKIKKYMIGTYAKSGEFFPLCEYGNQGATWYVNAPENESLQKTISRFALIDDEYIDKNNMMLKEIEIAPEEAENYICANPDDE